jgi:ATP-dependent Clp protease ATP-binding subunit ClpB
VDFRNAVLIMTSNVASGFILESSGDGSDWDRVEERVRDELHDHFRPEFLNRIDDVLVYRPLTREHLNRIVELQLDRLGGRLAEQDLTLDVTPEARRRIADAGYDPAFGARPLKRAIQRLVADPLALQFLDDRFREGDTVRVDVTDDEEELSFSRVPGTKPESRTATSVAG